MQDLLFNLNRAIPKMVRKDLNKIKGWRLELKF